MKISKGILLLLSLSIVALLAFPYPALAAAPGPRAGNNPAKPLNDVIIELSPTEASLTGTPNSIVTYTLTLKNSGDLPGSPIIELSGCTWQCWLSNVPTTLAAGESATFTVSVAIPGDAVQGVADTATVKVTGFSTQATLTTRSLLPTATVPASFSRPVMSVDSYSIDKASVAMGQDFTLTVNLSNRGQTLASNIIVEFSGADFLPRGTGGVQSVASLAVGAGATITQPLVATWDLWGKTVGTTTAKISYTDSVGTAYTETFTISINLAAPGSSSSSSSAKTATPTMVPRSQLVINSYHLDVDPLQPGSIFNLELEVLNLGSADARSVSMVLGGGVTSSDASGTPVPGGISGSSDMTNFAPLGSSNVMYLGDVAVSGGFKVTMKLIVNVNTAPGAYPLKFSFVSTDVRGIRQVDDQVITLLVYSLPQVEVNFYRDPGIFYTGQPNSIPLQVNNMGKKTAVLGNMIVKSGDNEVMNGTALVGMLDSGGYWTMDAMVIPNQAGPLDLEITINYTDDFNQPRTITQTLTVQVEEAPPMDLTTLPGMEGGENSGMIDPGAVSSETFGEKALRFLKGLIGLDSAVEQPSNSFGPMDIQPESIPLQSGGKG